MKKEMKKEIKKAKQSGFSLIELSLVITIIALLTIGINIAFTSIKENLKVKEATTALEFSINAGIQECYSRSGTLDGCDTAKIQRLSALKSDITPWGEKWTAEFVDVAGAVPAHVLVKYPFLNSGDGSNIVTDLISKFGSTFILKTPGIQAAADATTATQLNIQYTR